jgi:ribosomal protein S27AE
MPDVPEVRLWGDGEQAHDIRYMLAKGEAIRCPRCGLISTHPKDISEGYCGKCHDWTSPKEP